MAPPESPIAPTPPRRGDPVAYERYLASMDAAMKQKVALTAAHLLARGTVADMGMGSGAGSEALAALYPELDVVGVDLDPSMVEHARARYQRPNLSFVAGDIARPVFAPASLDGIFDSSVLHHVTSFGGYRHDNAKDALAVQAAALRAHGVLVVRDFVDPTREGRGDDPVELALPDDDGAATADDPAGASTAALFVRFAREFRSLHEAPGFAFEEATTASDRARRWRRFRLPHRLAAEFVLRKDYRTDWVAEVKEEYTYFTQRRFEEVFASLGLRLLASTPIRNPWIVRHRLEGRCELYETSGAPLDVPPTNTLVAGERVGDGEGVRFAVGPETAPTGYLELCHYRHKTTGQVRDLVRKPNLLFDIVPTFALGAERFVVARMSYPRPLLACAPAADAALDGGRPSPYVTEPLNARQGDKPLGQTVEEALDKALGLPAGMVRAIEAGPLLYPSPGGVQEEVRTVFVEIDELLVADRVVNFSGFSTSGRVRAIEARQVLRAAQVGGLPDARLEAAVYALFARTGTSPGPYLGESLELGSAAVASALRTTLPDLLARPRRRVFERCNEGAGFLAVRAAPMRELDGAGRVIAERVLERVEPRGHSLTTVAVALLANVDGVAYIGVDDDDLPAAQAFDGSSALLVAPAWRLPAGMATYHAAHAFVRDRLEREYGVTGGRFFSLGGSYTPAPGVTPEVVVPLAFEVTRHVSREGGTLRWVPLATVKAHLDRLPDLHLRVTATRAAHALGLLG